MQATKHPHIDAKPQYDVGSEMVEEHLKVPKNADDNWVQGKLKTSVQKILIYNNLIIFGLRGRFMAKSPDAVFHEVAEIFISIIFILEC
jgi:hypothetical protein